MDRTDQVRDGSGLACRLAHDPSLVVGIDALDRHNQNGRRGVGVHLFHRHANGIGKRGAGFDDHHHFVAALECPLPPIIRYHPGEDVDASA